MIDHPYTDNDFEEIVKARSVLASLIPFMEKMENCGADCAQKRENIKFLDNVLSSYQTQFFGHRQ